MFVVKLLILSIIGAFIGWITNLVAVKLLFRPLNAVKLPFGVKLQGVLPARKNELAVSIGDVIEKQLISPDEIMKTLVSDKDINHLKSTIVINVIKILKDKLPGFLHGFTEKTVKKQLDAFMEKEGDQYIRSMLKNTITNATQNLSVSQMVTEKIEVLDLAAFESMVESVVKKELRYIECFGAVIGFLIGLLQGLVLLLF